MMVPLVDVLDMPLQQRMYGVAECLRALRAPHGKPHAVRLGQLPGPMQQGAVDLLHLSTDCICWSAHAHSAVTLRRQTCSMTSLQKLCPLHACHATSTVMLL